jgi:phosphoglycolate phosphatase-like HAD superfamily hydrolase
MKIYKCIIYDFDGVICDSVHLKADAFMSMYESYGADVVEKVRSYHLLHGGISRFEKFKYYNEVILKKVVTEEELVELGNCFSKIVLDKIVAASVNQGVIEFLESKISCSLQFICSGTPHEEINYIIREKGLSRYFTDVFGSPDSKTIIINRILSKYDLKSNDVLFLGDAMTDYIAAKETNVDFVGIENLDTIFPQGTFTIKSFNELL